jgi:hypothetical protein
MAKKKTSKFKTDPERLRELIEEATVDCYDEEEQRTGILTMIEDNVVCPFQAKVVGEPVEVTGFEWPKVGLGYHAVCKRNGKEYRIDVNSLEFVDPLPEGYEWIEAYFSWVR